MLKKVYRLRKNKDFRKLYQRGKVVKNSCMVLYGAKSKRKHDDTICRVGFSVSKKIGKAHTRNYVKRKLRHASMPLLPTAANNFEGSFRRNYDYIIIARQGALETSKDALQNQIAYLLKQLHA